MTGPIEYCPTCDGMRNVTVSIGMQTQHEPEGEETTRILYHYHCRSCNTYLCSHYYLEEQPAVAIMESPQYAEYLG